MADTTTTAPNMPAPAPGIDPSISQGAQQVISKTAQANAYGVSLVPYHTHNGTDSSQVAGESLSLIQSIANNVTILRHGFAPQGDNNAQHFLNGQGEYVAVSFPTVPTVYSQAKLGSTQVALSAETMQLAGSGPLSGADKNNNAYIWLSSSAAAVSYLYQIAFDANSNVPYITSTFFSEGNQVAGAQIFFTILGSYIYFVFEEFGTTNCLLHRLDLGTLANDTSITFSGATPTANHYYPIFNDGTNLYICDGATTTTIKKYSISGTTATFVSNATYNSFIGNSSAWCDGTHVYQWASMNTLNRWGLGGGVVTQFTNFNFTGITNWGGSFQFPAMFGMVGGTQAYVMFCGSEAQGTATTVKNSYFLGVPVTKP